MGARLLHLWWIQGWMLEGHTIGKYRGQASRRAYESGPGGSGFESRWGQLILLLSKEITQYC